VKTAKSALAPRRRECSICRWFGETDSTVGLVVPAPALSHLLADSTKTAIAMIPVRTPASPEWDGASAALRLPQTAKP
jgi:hypothetical protein